MGFMANKLGEFACIEVTLPNFRCFIVEVGRRKGIEDLALLCS